MRGEIRLPPVLFAIGTPIAVFTPHRIGHVRTSRWLR
jgi:hypothetical protein